MSEEAKFKEDGWENQFAGMGGNMDKRKETRYGQYVYIDENELGNIYLGDGIGTRIIDAPVDDMTREWVSIDTEKDEDSKKLLEKLTSLGAEKKLNEALKWSDLYGGALIVVGAMDGKNLEEPLGNVKSIEWLTVINSTDIEITSSDYDNDPKSPTYGKILLYKVEMPENESKSRVQYRSVHRSRVIEFKGSPIPDRSVSITDKQRYWGVSKLQPIYERLRDFGGFVTSTSNLMLELIIGVYKFENLDELLAEDNEVSLQKRMEIIHLSKSMINGVILDKEEDFSRTTANVSGIPELFDRWVMLVSGIAQIPASRLFSKQVTGLNSKDTGSRDIYYDMVKARSRLDFVPAVQTLVNVLAKTMNIGKAVVVANPLIQMSPTEEAALGKTKAEEKKLQAEADEKNIALGIYDAVYVQKRDGIIIE